MFNSMTGFYGGFVWLICIVGFCGLFLWQIFMISLHGWFVWYVCIDWFTMLDMLNLIHGTRSIKLRVNILLNSDPVKNFTT